MDSYSKYLNAIIHASVNTDRSVHNENLEEYERLFRNKILNLDGPTSLE
ncbi:MAG: hypothetical protein BMS9Abin31_1162 [Gammaproteobacteria bacterium]|nr:MAG: hypothetical protein BMS9Abin31_1162 [Gammaproteobacteria bacterium]